VALPLVRIKPIFALEGAAAPLAPGHDPGVSRSGALTWRHAYSRAVALAVVAMVAVWFGRAAVPPAPLFVARATWPAE